MPFLADVGKDSNGGPSTNNPKIPTIHHVDLSKPGHQQRNIHTRWHPEIPCIGSIPLDQPFMVECLDFSGGQIRNDDSIDDVVLLEHDSDHHLSGPFEVPGAQPGDVLEIEIVDVSPFASQSWGYSITAPGLGSLDHPEHETKTTKSIWDFQGATTSSRHIPHVSFHGRPHPGIIGTAPSHALLRQWTDREAQLSDSGAKGPALPLSHGAYVGQELHPEVREQIYRDGARTAPGREHGGNTDIGSLTNGSKLYLPVYVPGANLSVGDLHFCEGDGEPTTAIEMAGILTLRVKVLSGGIPDWILSAPMYLTSPTEPIYRDRLVFTGLSTRLDGSQTDCGGIEAYRNAAFAVMDYLGRFGYTREQVYILLAVAPIETKVVATANKPNFIVSLGIPLDIFGFDIRPGAVVRAMCSVKT